MGDAGDSTDGMKQGGFANAGGADDGQRFAGGNRKRDVVKNQGLVEYDGEIRNFKHDSLLPQ